MQASCGNPGCLASLLDIPIEQDNLYDQQQQEHPYDSVSHNKYSTSEKTVSLLSLYCIICINECKINAKCSMYDI
jgi:hypothetical protein